MTSHLLGLTLRPPLIPPNFPGIALSKARITPKTNSTVDTKAKISQNVPANNLIETLISIPSQLTFEMSMNPNQNGIDMMRKPNKTLV